MPPSPQDPSASVLRAQLQESLGDAYTIERELGGGGMSRVFVARERSLDRLVVVKVLPHELAAGMNSERFRREIQLVAGLQHPHIVPVLAAGEAAGAPFYTMPFIDGESLRARRGKLGVMPLNDAVRVLHDVIDALAYAHERGIVHRDIKPDNILMSGTHAVVTDFGVAKALSAANVVVRDADSSGTGIGMAVGTPAYMAPEQAAGDPDTDHRADIYAWGLLAYELLAGTPPFSQRPSHEMLAAHIAEIPEALSDRAPELPQSLNDLVMQCLEKRPASRPQSAAEVRDALEQAATPGGGTPIMRAAVRWSRRPRTATLISLAVLVMAIAGAFAFRPRARTLDANQVAVLPFRLASADPSLRYLREGMLDLLAAKLTGEGGPRSSDPRTLLSAWRRAVRNETEDLPRDRALDLAEQLGAGQLLIGDIAGNAQRLTITATLVGVRDGRADDPRSVSGPADSLSAMVDRLASELLALRAGEGERIGAFAGVPLPALRAYLDGTALYRRAHFAAASREFERAIGLDSTFALAGLGLSTASGWLGTPKDQFLGRTVAWNHRERLNPRDRALLLATAGPNFPGSSGWRALIAAKERYAALAPDRADAQFELGDGLFHFGAAAGIPDAHARAMESFNRAIALDSSFSPAIEHLVVLELERGDTARVIRLAQLYLAADSASENRDGMRWSLAIARGDMASARAVLARRDSLSSMAKITITELPYVTGRDIEAAQTLVDTPTRSDADLGARFLDLVLRHDIAMNRGRPARGAAHLDSLRLAQPNSDDFYRVTDGLFWDGDSAAADIAAQSMRRKAALGGPIPGTFKRGKDPAYFADLCMSELWYLSRGDTTGARRVSRVMLTNYDSRDSLSSPPMRMGCALILDAQLAVMQQRPDAHARVDSLDAFLRTAPDGPILRMGNLVTSRLYERLGDTRAALFAVRRRDFFYGRASFLSTYLRDEARLAEKAGDAAGAAEALRRYVALRGDPEPALQADVTAATEAHARLSKSLAGR
jgi:TolB-like protein